MASNVSKLEAAGLVYSKTLPQEHRKVLNGLTEEEMDVILSVAKQLAKADRAARLRSRPPFTTYMTF
jgi:DNA-binding MarR family transcriptional regulator